LSDRLKFYGTGSEIIPCYYKYNDKQKMLIKGEKPDIFPTNTAITKKDWQRTLKLDRKISNPVQTGFQFIQYLEENPNATYDDMAAEAGITKARVCQIIALCNRLPGEITEYLSEIDDHRILKYFTERRLRPLTRLTSDDDKLKKFDEMRLALTSCEYSKTPLDF
jgi:hypothetical protein